MTGGIRKIESALKMVLFLPIIGSSAFSVTSYTGSIEQKQSIDCGGTEIAILAVNHAKSHKNYTGKIYVKSEAPKVPLMVEREVGSISFGKSSFM